MTIPSLSDLTPDQLVSMFVNEILRSVEVEDVVPAATSYWRAKALQEEILRRLYENVVLKFGYRVRCFHDY